MTDAIEALKARWTDKFVRPNAERPELARFAGRVGRVVTVNMSGKLIVDWGDGSWYDLPAEGWVEEISEEEGRAKYDATANSAQKSPPRA